MIWSSEEFISVKDLVKDLWTQKQDSYILERRKTSPDLLTVVCKTYKQQWCIKDHILELPALVMSSWNTDKTPPSFSSTASCAQTVPICTNTMILFPVAAPSVATLWLNSCLSHPEDLQHNHVYTSHPCALELGRQADSGTAFQTTLSSHDTVTSACLYTCMCSLKNPLQKGMIILNWIQTSTVNNQKVCIP